MTDPSRPAAWTQSDPEQMRERLAAWAREGPGGRIEHLRRMPGHSGTSYGFDLVSVDGTRDPLVVRVPPFGVRHEGVTDVLRQAPLLEVLAGHGVPVPRVRFHGDGARWFGTPYLIVGRVEGHMPGDIFAGAVPAPTRAARDTLFDEAMGVLARIHDAGTARLPAGWSTPANLPALVDHWLALLERCERPDLLAPGRAAHAALRAAAPDADPRPGLVHGDFYQNNWMVADGRLTAVLDWESAHIGPSAIDVGYVAMMYDPAGWDPHLRTDLVDDDRPGHLLEAYTRASGAPVARATWFRALAGLRIGALTAYFVRLHRTGRRPDPTWDVIGPSAPFMLANAAALLDA